MKPKFPLKKLLLLLLNFVISFVLLRLVIELSERTGMLWIYFAGTGVYAALIIVLFVAFFLFVGDKSRVMP